MRTSAFSVLAKTDACLCHLGPANLERSLRQEDVRIQGSTSKAELRHGRYEHMLMIYVFLMVMSARHPGSGGLGLATTMSLNVMERRREMGVLRAIGATSTTVWLIIVIEGVVGGSDGWAIAALAAWPVARCWAIHW